MLEWLDPAPWVISIKPPTAVSNDQNSSKATRICPSLCEGCRSPSGDCDLAVTPLEARLAEIVDTDFAPISFHHLRGSGREALNFALDPVRSLANLDDVAYAEVLLRPRGGSVNGGVGQIVHGFHHRGLIPDLDVAMIHRAAYCTKHHNQIVLGLNTAPETLILRASDYLDAIEKCDGRVVIELTEWSIPTIYQDEHLHIAVKDARAAGAKIALNNIGHIERHHPDLLAYILDVLRPEILKVRFENLPLVRRYARDFLMVANYLTSTAEIREAKGAGAQLGQGTALRYSR